MQLGVDVGAHQRIVLHHQDRLAAAFHLGRRWLCRDLLRRGIRLRQIELEGRAKTLLAVKLDVAAGLLDEAVDHAQPEPGSLAHTLGRKERIEHPVADRLGNSGAGIAHRDHDIIADLNVAIGRGIILIETHIVGFQNQLAAARHGVAGVDRKIEQRSTELARVDQGRPQLVRQHRFDFDLLAQGRPHQLCGFHDQAVDVGFARLQRLLAGEGQKMPGELGAAVGRLADQRGDRNHVRLVGNLLGQDFDGPGDDGEHIVEIMRDAAGQLPERVHLLRLSQLLFRRDLMGQVPDEGVEHVAAAAAQRLQRHFDLERISILAHCFGFKALPDVGALLHAHHALFHALIIRTHRFRQQQADQVASHRLMPRPSEDRFGLRIPLQDDAAIVGLDKCLQRVGDDVPRHLLAFEQRLLRHLLRGDIAGNAGGADDRSRLRPDRGDAERDVDPPVILIDANRFVVDSFANSYFVPKALGLASQRVRNDDVDAAADRFLRGKSEQPLGGRIPAGDDAVERFGHDRIVGGFHCRDEELLALEGAAAFLDLLIERLGLGP